SGDTVKFDAGLNGQTITPTSGTIHIETSLTISGPGSANLTISGNHTQGIFVIFGATTVNISGLSLKDGNFGFDGGAIENKGVLSLMDCEISGNSTSFSGGGISNEKGAQLTVTNCKITNNTATDDGGGIANFGGTVTVVGSTVSGNKAILSNAGGLANNSA